MIITDDCIACGCCSDYCLMNAIIPKENRNSKSYSGYEVNQELCIKCNVCIECDCPGNALTIE